MSTRRAQHYKEPDVTSFALPSNVHGLTLLGISLVALTLPGFAAASLGGPESSVADDAAVAHATRHMEQRAAYRLHEINLPSGTVLHEYVNAAGVVFAVSWHGPRLPNLKQTLGQYSDTYAAAAHTQAVPHRAVRVQEENLVIQSVGHMRAFSGIAYLPKLMPAGVAAGDLQ